MTGERAVGRVVMIVMDSFGVGAAPDAGEYGDAGADTFGHILDRKPDLAIPHLRELGFCNITNAGGGRLAISSPRGAFGRMREVSRGKDTVTGHWELAGLKTDVPFKTYPDGFPPGFIARLEEAIGRKTLGNYAESGTVIIEQLGAEHEATGSPIVYTSTDSVFQIAANTAVIPLEELYRICETARWLLQGEWACARVIARPYVIENGARVRTADRRDYAVAPHGGTMLDSICAAGLDVVAIGKIRDIFAGRGITRAIHTSGNMDGVDQTISAMREDSRGLIFTNLVDFDSQYGHRRNAEGYARAVEELDARLPELEAAARPDDLLVITADHGTDPTYTGWDHTREYVPVLLWGRPVRPGADVGTRETFADLAATITDLLGAERTPLGTSFAKEILL